MSIHSNVRCSAQRLAGLLLPLLIAGCAATTPASAPDWRHLLRGDTIALFGEIHDNPAHHSERLSILKSALQDGWRPAIAMEQFDRERQTDIDRARQERPQDAGHVIRLAATPAAAGRGSWNWNFYRPFIELALEYGLPLIAANLSNADARKVVQGGTSAVFGAESDEARSLADPARKTLHEAQMREVDAGHCHALPQRLLPAMAQAQMARDAVMASLLSPHAREGLVLIAGNGHVRRDIGVPRWLDAALLQKTWSVGFLEWNSVTPLDKAFDATVRTAAVDRPDPCLELKNRLKSPQQ